MSSSPELLDELTAYLDGELDAAGSRRVEELLARDPQVRAELQRLERAWRLLEELPQGGVDEAFTRSTVAMVALAAEEEVAGRTMALPTLRRRRWSLSIAGLACAAVVGFAGFRFLVPDENGQLLRDLPMIERLDEYRQAGEIEFLRLMAEEKLFLDEEDRSNDGLGVDPAVDVDGPGATAAVTGGPSDVAARRSRIESMSPAEKDQLQQQQQRFAALPPPEQDKLRQLDSQLEVDPRGDELRQVMARYHEWLANLHPSQREELRALPPQQRLERVKQLRGEQKDREQTPLQPEDRQVLIGWLEGILQSKLKPDELRRWEQMTASERQFALRSQLQKRANQPKAQRLPELTLAQVEELYTRLSPSAKAALDGKPDTLAKRRLLAQWVVQSLRLGEQRGPEALAAAITPEELRQFRENELTDRQRQELERLGPMERQRRLRMMYLNWKYPERPWRELRQGGGRLPPLDEPGRQRPGDAKQKPGKPPAGEAGGVGSRSPSEGNDRKRRTRGRPIDDNTDLRPKTND